MRFHFHLDFEIISVRLASLNRFSDIPDAQERRQANCLNRAKRRTSSLARREELCDCQNPQFGSAQKFSTAGTRMFVPLNVALANPRVVRLSPWHHSSRTCLPEAI
jgi:hypothetical protein